MSHKSRRLMGGIGRPMQAVGNVRTAPPSTVAKPSEKPPEPEVSQTNDQSVDSQEKTRRVRMKADQKVKAVTWLMTNWTMLEKEKFLPKELCARMEQAGLESVTPRSLNSLCRVAGLNIFDIITVHRRGGRQGSGKDHGPHNALRKVCTQLAYTQDVIRALCERIGEPFDPEGILKTQWLKDFAGGKANANDDYHMG